MTRLRKDPLTVGILMVSAFVLASTWACAPGHDLVNAAEKGDLPRVKALVADGVDVDARRDSETALMTASRMNHAAVVKTLLDAKADVNAKNKFGFTALMTASIGGNLEVVRVLLDAKADLNAECETGSTALMMASDAAKKDLFLGSSPMSASDRQARFEVFRLLLNAEGAVGANPFFRANHIRDSSGDLRNAAFRGDLPRLKARLDAYAGTTEVNWTDGAGDTALMLASLGDHLDVVQALLAARADVNASDRQGFTALMMASQYAQPQVVRALLAAKAHASSWSGRGTTALIMASNSGHLEVVRALLAANADVNAKQPDGFTPLMIASQHGHLEVVRALLAAGANMDAKDNSGNTALQVASGNGHQEIVQLLKSAGAAVR